jgi:hypothetical protein
MSNQNTALIEKSGEPSYVGWRGELLAELALARVPGLTVTKRPDRPAIDWNYDYLVATRHGKCFAVKVAAFASSRSKIDVDNPNREWKWNEDSVLIREAIESRIPYFLFLFDADQDQGRFLRLDTLPIPTNDPIVPVELPSKNVIDRERIERIVDDLDWTDPSKRISS